MAPTVESVTLTGGLGADSFVFKSTASGVDVISDFNELNGGGEEGDVLQFEGLGVGTFAYLGTGNFSGGSDNSEALVSGCQVLVDTNGDPIRQHAKPSGIPIAKITEEPQIIDPLTANN